MGQITSSNYTVNTCYFFVATMHYVYLFIFFESYCILLCQCVNISYCIFYSCNMGTSGLPDMYTRCPRAEGGHIR